MKDPSNQFLDANLAGLSPTAARALGAITIQPAVTLQTSGCLLKASVKTDAGRWVSVHASEDPIAGSDQAAARIAASNPPLIVVIGLGLGYLLDALERRGSSANVLAIEPIPAIARAMLTRRDWTSWLASGRLTLLIGPDYAGASEVWSLFGPGAATPPTIMSPMLEREFSEEASRATALVRQIVSGARANEEARRLFAGRYLLNTLTNLPTIATEGDVSALAGAFPRVPAVVVGAGPSLDKNLEDIAKLDGKVLVIAVDTAVRPLLAAGIRPHLVVAVDPSDLNARHLADLPDPRGLWFVAEASTDPVVFPQFTGRTFTFKVSNHHPWPWLHEHGSGRGTLRAWGSVLTTAFDLACQMGCDPIVFAGADLAFTDGLQYCRNTVYEDRWRTFTTDEARADVFKMYLKDRPHLAQPDVRGGEVLTTPHFVQFRDWLVARANEAADRRIVNATGGGILHGGRVAQTDFAVLHLPKAKHDLGLQRRIAAAWASGAETRRSSLDPLQAGLQEDRLPLQTWLAFGGDTTTVFEIERRAATATRGLAAASCTTEYLAARSLRIDAQAETLDMARASIHPDYDFACAQAEAQQAHVLLDWLQRSYHVEPGEQARDIVRAASTLPRELRILDIGCGLGRSMAPLVAAGYHVDGVDVSQRMVDLARQNPRLSSCQFFVSDGQDLGSAPDGRYDIAYSHLCFHLITSRIVRRRLIAAAARALAPSGALVVQLPFYPDERADAVPFPHVSWEADVVAGEPVHYLGHVRATPDALPMILEDFSEHFRDVRLQVVDFPDDVTCFDGAHARITHLVVSGSPAGGLAGRMYAPIHRSAQVRHDAAATFGATTQR